MLHPPRPNTVLVHVGPHKTGTTAIQRTLVENAGELQTRGMVYPRVGFSYFGHHQLAALLEQPNTDALAEMEGELQQLRDQVVILSSENFSRASAAGLQRLAQLLSGFREVEIVVYLRNFLELLYPWWQELVKHRIADDIGSFLVDCLVRPFRTHLLDAGGMLERFATAFDGRLSIYLYDNAMREHGDIANHFMWEVLGAESYQPVPGITFINKSLDPAATEIVRCLNISGEYGITVLERNADAKNLCSTLRDVAKNYERKVILSYDQYVPRQMEMNLIRSLRRLHLGSNLGLDEKQAEAKNEIFEKREHEIRYVDPLIWLMEPDLASKMRAIMKDVESNRALYVRAPLDALPDKA